MTTATTDPDRERGLYPKYRVEKVNGKPVGECFVLEAHDPHAAVALHAYAASCASEFQPLATDVTLMADRWQRSQSQTAYYERHFVTEDGPTFQMIEDESGDIWWGYGHRDGPEFTEEVNRWLVHVNAATVPDDLFAASTPVEHLWARMDDEHGERFTLVDKPWLGTKEAADDLFPVTRLML